MRGGVGKNPTGSPCHREQQNHDNRHTGNRAHALCSACMEKCHFVSTWGVALGPCLCLFKLGATIKSISGLVEMLPLGGIFADGLLKRDVITCLAQPACKAGPLTA